MPTPPKPSSETTCYILYSYQRGRDLYLAVGGLLSGGATTQELTVHTRLVVDLQGDRFRVGEWSQPASTGIENQFRLILDAVQPIPFLGGRAAEVENALEIIIAYATGDPWPDHSIAGYAREVELLRWALSSPYSADRKSAVTSLGMYGDVMPQFMNEVIPALIQALSDDRAEVSSNALAWLREITHRDLGDDPGRWLEWWESQD